MQSILCDAVLTAAATAISQPEQLHCSIAAQLETAAEYLSHLGRCDVECSCFRPERQLPRVALLMALQLMSLWTSMAARSTDPCGLTETMIGLMR
jgi:hypothetical protein